MDTNVKLIPQLHKALLFVIPMWVVYIIEIALNRNFNNFGIYPEKFYGLRGVLFSPFLHGDINHLFNNTVPILVLTTILFFFYRKIANKVFFYGFFLTGILTWLLAQDNYHIGASGIVYMLFGFVFFSGIIRKHFRLTAISLMVIFLYGSMFWYIFPIEDKISWEGHLSGLIIGLLFAVIYRKKGPKPKEFTFSKTEFDTWFDQDGNFSPPIEEENDEEEDDLNENNPKRELIEIQKPKYQVKYLYKKSNNIDENEK
ncbi:rhomboid family intramembrane serine protease [Aureivirga sp. CE67]|uniref:rhomboid family intramembrane serine protease n=1 Tax=Aureivirga sp. CE67 TaxID=1788983 RepID=UPI0018C9ED0C|nr:rhomboid family intramembrane serine protease [Aureivirga sp. CE67]